MGIGGRVRSARELQGLSLSELARMSGVSKGYLSQIERSPGARPSASTLFRISQVLGTTVGELLGEEAMEPDDGGAAVDIPPGLQELAHDENLPDAEVRMLARIRYRGRSPKTKDDWRYVYESIRRSVRPR